MDLADVNRADMSEQCTGKWQRGKLAVHHETKVLKKPLKGTREIGLLEGVWELNFLALSAGLRRGSREITTPSVVRSKEPYLTTSYTQPLLEASMLVDAFE